MKLGIAGTGMIVHDLMQTIDKVHPETLSVWGA